MKKNGIGLFLSLALMTTVFAEGRNVILQNTIEIKEGDSKEVIMEKAAHVVPTRNQWRALQDEFIAFIHFGPNTFTQREWGDGKEDPKVFNLKDLDTDQWCKTMKSAGMKTVLLTAKHHDGFVLWQSRYTKHGVMSSPFREGKGDVLKDFSKSCQKFGLKLGIYLSPADLYQIENAEGLYGNLSKYTKRTIPREVPGRPFKNKTKFEFELDDYNEYFLNQLFEVLTEYGPIHEVWFDGAHPKTKGGQKYNYAAWKKLIKKLAPEAVIFGREDIRWCGNEAGGTRSTEWNVIPFAANPNVMDNFPDLTGDDLGSREQLYKGKYLHYQQAETNTSIREGWFYRDDTRQKVRSADDVFDIYERSVGGNSTFLLNIPPNREGRFSPKDVEVLEETGRRIRETYGRDLLKGAKGAGQVLDNDSGTGLSLDKDKPEIVISLAERKTMNRLVIQESVVRNGERVEKHAVDAWIDGAWKEIAHATNIGYKRILRFPQVTTDKIRVRVTESRLAPVIDKISAHYYTPRPPQLHAERDAAGMVRIESLRQEFGWKPHGHDASRNLNTGTKIYYTTDGSEPDSSSVEYKEPFLMEKGELKAASVFNGRKGALLQERFGYPKRDWKLLSVSSEVSNHAASLAFDSNPGTYWMSVAGEGAHSIDIDLGKEQSLTGFGYTPQQEHAGGMMAKGIVKISDDGKVWKELEKFEFGNLINDPAKRYHFFKKAGKARYIRIESTETAADGKEIAAAELDFF